MPSIGPIGLPESNDTVRFAYGYLDYTIHGSEVAAAFIPGPAIVYRAHFIVTASFDVFATQRFGFKQKANDDTVLTVTFAEFNPTTDADVQVGGGGAAFNSSDSNYLYSATGLHITATYFTDTDTPTQGAGYVVFEYLAFPAPL